MSVLRSVLHFRNSSCDMVAPRSHHARAVKFLYVLVAAIAPWPSLAIASVLDGHAVVGTHGTGSGGGDNGLPSGWYYDGATFSSALTGDALSISSEGSGGLNGFQQDTSFAAVTPFNSASLLHVSAASLSNGGNIYIGSYANAVAGWRDVTFVTGAKLPDSIRLNFGINGSIGVNSFGDVPGAFGEARLGAFVGTSSALTTFTSFLPAIGDFYTPQVYGLESISDYSAVGGDTFRQLSAYGFDDAIVASEGISHTVFHYDAPYNPALGGYDWSVLFTAVSSGHHGSGFAYGTDSLSLQSLTLLDGTPLAAAGLSYSFDSGLTMSPPPATGVTAVPEPSSVCLGVIGLCSFAWLARRRMVKAQRFLDSAIPAF